MVPVSLGNKNGIAHLSNPTALAACGTYLPAESCSYVLKDNFIFTHIRKRRYTEGWERSGQSKDALLLPSIDLIAGDGRAVFPAFQGSYLSTPFSLHFPDFQLHLLSAL